HQNQNQKNPRCSADFEVTFSVTVQNHRRWGCVLMADNEELSMPMPRDAKIIESLLKSMGVYSEHATKSAIDVDDVKLAIQSQANFSFSQPPPREVLLELAKNRNKIPLPKSLAPGIPLPPDQDTLISPNYQFAFPNKRSAEPIEETEEEEPANADPNPSQEEKTDAQQNPTQRVSFPLPKRQKD
ncbi:unnamed protein product, partial [Vicia faba]